MRRVDVHAEAAEGRIKAAPPTPLTLFWTRICAHPATVFLLLSLVFGSVIVFATPPLRGPDEIAHFLRIYSYVRGDVLPPAEVDGLKTRKLTSSVAWLRNTITASPITGADRDAVPGSRAAQTARGTAASHPA